MIRLAEMKDLESIMKIIRDIVIEMKNDNTVQWDENYPREEDFIRDIENGSLYVNQERGNIRAFICLDRNQPVDYTKLQWKGEGQDFLVIHRMAVNKDYRNQGLGLIMFNFAKDFAREKNIGFIRTDTYSLNYRMRGLFRKLGFVFVGEADFGKEEKFYCYEWEIA